MISLLIIPGVHSVPSSKKTLRCCTPSCEEDILRSNSNLPHNFSIENLFLSYGVDPAPSGSTSTPESLLSSSKVLKRSWINRGRLRDPARMANRQPWHETGVSTRSNSRLINRSKRSRCKSLIEERIHVSLRDFLPIALTYFFSRVYHAGGSLRQQLKSVFQKNGQVNLLEIRSK